MDNKTLNRIRRKKNITGEEMGRLKLYFYANPDGEIDADTYMRIKRKFQRIVILQEQEMFAYYSRLIDHLTLYSDLFSNIYQEMGINSETFLSYIGLLVYASADNTKPVLERFITGATVHRNRVEKAAQLLYGYADFLQCIAQIYEEDAFNKKAVDLKSNIEQIIETMNKHLKETHKLFNKLPELKKIKELKLKKATEEQIQKCLNFSSVIQNFKAEVINYTPIEILTGLDIVEELENVDKMLDKIVKRIVEFNEYFNSNKEDAEHINEFKEIKDGDKEQ